MPQSKRSREPNDDSDGEDESVEGGVAPSEGFSLAGLLIIIEIVKRCKLCGEYCNSEFEQGEGGFRPWARYKKSKKNKGYKTPAGHFCLICMNVWKALGHNISVKGGLKAFAKWASDPIDRLHKFQRSVDVWIKKHAAGQVRMRDKSDLKDAQSVVVENTTGRRRKQKLVFVELSTYLTDFGAPSDTGAKVETEEIDGKEVEGVWIAEGKKGYHKFEAYEDSGVKHSTVVDSGEGTLSSTQVQSKYMTLAKTMQDDAKKKVDNAKHQLDNLIQLALANHCPRESRDTPKGGSKQADDLNDESDSDIASASNSSDEDEGLGVEDVLPLGRSIVKAKAKASPAVARKSASGAPASKPPNANAAAKRSKSVASSTGTGAAASTAPSGPPASVRDVAALDGRVDRVIENVKAEMEKMDPDLDNYLSIAEETSSVAAEEQAFKAAMKERVTTGSALQKKVKDCITRIERSKAKPMLEEQLQELHDKEMSVKAALDLAKMLSIHMPPPEALQKSIEKCLSLGIKLSSSIQVLSLRATADTHFKFEKYTDLCADLKIDSALISSLLSTSGGASEETLRNLACQLFEERTANSIRALKDVAPKSREYKNTCKSLLSLATAASKVGNQRSATHRFNDPWHPAPYAGFCPGRDSGPDVLVHTAVAHVRQS
jgi:hypothetical protein